MVNKTSSWTLFLVSCTLVILGKRFDKDQADNCDKVMNPVTCISVAHAEITRVFNISMNSVICIRVAHAEITTVFNISMNSVTCIRVA